jgi:hypothetical protein
LKTDFPKSFSIEFSALSQSVLPIKGLPECGQHHLFANAVKYPALHPQIVAYINLAKGKWEWYNNLEEEHCAMPSTFAVFALGLDNEKYFDIVIDYMRTVDDEHQSIQGEFVPVFVEKYGINSESVKVYINCIMSMQELPYNKVYLHQFTDEAGLNLLLDSKTNFAEYYFTEEDMEEMEDSGNDTDEIAGYIWERILYTTFGEKKNYEGILKQYPDKLKALFDKI